MAYASVPAASRPASIRWMQLIAGIICMVMIANLQYGWTLFVNPIKQTHGWAVVDIQLAFSLFVALETWLTPIEGWLADWLGPKLLVAAGGMLVAIGWILNCLRRRVVDIVSRGLHHRNRRRRRLCDVCRQFGEMVS